MEVILRVLSLVVYLALGSWLADRWVVAMRGEGWRKRGGFVAFVLVAWIGVFVLGWIQDQISIAYFDPEKFSDERGLSGEVVHDGVGSNVVALTFGWVLVCLCIGIAKRCKFR